jgi:hypothetical protein
MGRVSEWPGLEPLGPAPGESALTLGVPCCADPRALAAVRHPVTIGPDWSVEVPHDLDAERVAVALGGYSGCLELAERVVPAARTRLQALARRGDPQLARTRGGGWAPRVPVPRCCRPSLSAGAADPVTVAEHLRSNAHHAAAGGCRADLLRAVVRALVRAHTGGTSFTVAADDLAAAAPAVHGEMGVVRLWAVGVHPRVAVALHDLVAPDGPPLPAAFYLGVVTRGQDLDGLRGALAVWRQPHDDDPGSTVHREQPLGVPPRLVVELSLAGICPAGVLRLAEATGSGTGVAAALLARWVAAGCGGDVDAVARVYRTGVPVSFHPSRALLARLRGELGHDADGLGAVALAGLVGVAGSVPGAVAAVRRGVTDPVALAGELDGAVRCRRTG